jgi:hypothetical protein
MRPVRGGARGRRTRGGPVREREPPPRSPDGGFELRGTADEQEEERERRRARQAPRRPAQRHLGPCEREPGQRSRRGCRAVRMPESAGNGAREGRAPPPSCGGYAGSRGPGSEAGGSPDAACGARQRYPATGGGRFGERNGSERAKVASVAEGEAPASGGVPVDRRMPGSAGNGAREGRAPPPLRPTPPGTAFSRRGTGRYRRQVTPRAPGSGTDTVPYLGNGALRRSAAAGAFRRPVARTGERAFPPGPGADVRRRKCNPPTSFSSL